MSSLRATEACLEGIPSHCPQHQLSQEVPRTQQLSQWAGGGRHGGSRGPGGPRHSEELGSCESGQLPGADLEEQGVQGQEGARAWGQSVKRGGGRLRVFPS